MKKLTTDTFDYRRLSAKYPNNGPDYYIEYYGGDYYDRSTASYYGNNKELLEVKDNGYYG